MSMDKMQGRTLLDFTHHISNAQYKKNGGHDWGKDDVFRSEYPSHVRRKAECIRAIFKMPSEWKYLCRQYNVSRKTIRTIFGINPITVQKINLIKNCH